MKTSLQGAFLACVALAAAAYLALMVFGFVNLRSEYRQHLTEFPARHVEATGAINRIYAHYETNGAWPPEEDVNSTNGGWLPPEWEYIAWEEQAGAMLIRNGRFHDMLVYYFSQDEDGTLNRQWFHKGESVHQEFEADVTYAVEER